MNILHLTDLHFSNKSSDLHRQGKIIEQMVDDISKDKEGIDILLFTGDLVDIGNSVETFQNAKKDILDRIIEKFDLSVDKVFICPGNHDVDRKFVSSAVIEHIDKIRDNNTLNTFASRDNVDYVSSLKPLANYFEFTKNAFALNNPDDIYNEEYSCHIRQFGDTKLGIVCINTAWRAIGRNDTGSLIFPLKYIEDALQNIKNTDFKILIHHHPIADFKGYNKYELEDIIHNNFNISFSGHIHKDSASAYYTNKAGILQIEAAAALSEADGSTIGYTKISLSIEDSTAKCISHYYDTRREFFYVGSEKLLPIPVSIEKQEQNRFRKKIRQRIEVETDNANDLFLHGKMNRSAKGFADLWTPPVLSTKSSEQVRREDFAANSFDFNQLVNDNLDYIVMGKNKCGKTSLLKKIQIECLHQYSKTGIIPYYINAKSYAFSDENYREKLQRELAAYYGTNKADAGDILAQKKLLLLVDNVDLVNEQTAAWLQNILMPFANVRIIMCVDETSENRYKEVLIDGRQVTKVYFHSLKKKQIKELAQKLYGDNEDKIEIVKKISSIFGMLSIPFDFWSVSLFMWVFKESGSSIQNDVGLIDLYIESILERENLVRNKTSFGFEKYKLYLANLAKFLLGKPETFYSATYEEIIHFTGAYLSKNPRNDIEARKAWEYIEQKGIVKVNPDNSYTFRLNGIFEYFLSFYMKSDADFRAKVIEDRFLYLEFKNELEMYAGSNRSDEDFLAKIFAKTKEIFSELHSQYTLSDIEYAIQNLSCNPDTNLIKRSVDEIKVLSEAERDALEESGQGLIPMQQEVSCEVRVKTPVELDGNDLGSLEKALYILGRVFKNADQIDNVDLINEIFDYILEATCKWGFKMFQSLQEFDADSDSAIDKEQYESLLSLMQQVLPVIVESRIYDMIGASNMQTVIKERLKQAKTNKQGDNNQFRLFLLMYLLCDIDLKSNIEYISQSLELIKKPILKYAIVLKVLYYMNFKVDDFIGDTKKDIDSRLKSLYTKAQKHFNNKLSKESISHSVQHINKKRRIRKLGSN